MWETQNYYWLLECYPVQQQEIQQEIQHDVQWGILSISCAVFGIINCIININIMHFQLASLFRL